MHVFKVLFLYFREIEQYFRPRADLRGNNQRLNFTKNKLQRMSMAAMERYFTKHQQNEDDPCLKLRCYARERFFFFGKNLSSLQRSILSWVPVLARQVTQKRGKRNFPRALQNHIDFTRSDHR